MNNAIGRNHRRATTYEVKRHAVTHAQPLRVRQLGFHLSETEGSLVKGRARVGVRYIQRDVIGSRDRTGRLRLRYRRRDQEDGHE